MFHVAMNTEEVKNQWNWWSQRAVKRVE